MEQRLTKEIVLPKSGAKVVLYSYLVNGDYRIIEEKLAALIQPDFSSIDKNLPAEEQKRLRDEAIEHASVEMRAVAFIKSKNEVTKLLIKEVSDKDGQKVSNIDSFIYNLKRADGEFLDKEIEKIDQDSTMDEEEKKD